MSEAVILYQLTAEQIFAVVFGEVLSLWSQMHRFESEAQFKVWAFSLLMLQI